MAEELKTPEALEEEAMQQRLQELEEKTPSISEMGGLGVGKVPSPLEAPIEEKKEEVPEESARSTFLGDWTEEEVLNRLKSIEDMEERISSRLMGKLGPLGRELKALKESAAKEWSFDPAVLEPLKSLDEGIYDVLKDGLQKGLKLSGSSVRPIVEEVMKEHHVSLAAAFHDSVEERLISMLVPNYLDLSEEPEFVPWLMKEQKPEVIQAFRNWDDETSIGKKDAATLMRTYRAYEASKEEKAKEKKSKEDALKRSAVSSPKSGAPARPAPIQDEEAAFQARLREIEQQGLRLG